MLSFRHFVAYTTRPNENKTLTSLSLPSMIDFDVVNLQGIFHSERLICSPIYLQKPLFAEMRLALRGVQDGSLCEGTQREEEGVGRVGVRPTPDLTGLSADGRNRLPSISFATRPRWVFVTCWGRKGPGPVWWSWGGRTLRSTTQKRKLLSG